MKKAQDPISFVTHFYGGFASVGISLFYLIYGLVFKRPVLNIIGLVIFGFSAICLYFASALYHYYSDDNINKKILRKLDHSMIYILIVGSYTPFSLSYLDKPHAYYFVLVMWLIAIIGILLKVFWFNMPRFIYTSFYLILGWALVFDYKSFASLPVGCLVLLGLGGISYSIGAIVYILKKPNISTNFGFHELFHIFIMIGTFIHFMAGFIYVM